MFWLGGSKSSSKTDKHSKHKINMTQGTIYSTFEERYRNCFYPAYWKYSFVQKNACFLPTPLTNFRRREWMKLLLHFDAVICHLHWSPTLMFIKTLQASYETLMTPGVCQVCLFRMQPVIKFIKYLRGYIQNVEIYWTWSGTHQCFCINLQTIVFELPFVFMETTRHLYALWYAVYDLTQLITK